MRLIEITHDVCDIAQRIKEVDENYFIVFNRLLGRFELHDRSCRDSFACELPYDQLDARSIEHARMTRIERLESIIRELDRYNEKIMKGGAKA